MPTSVHFSSRSQKFQFRRNLVALLFSMDKLATFIAWMMKTRGQGNSLSSSNSAASDFSSLNYYEIFGVSRQASQDEIKKAYNNLMRNFHPDKNQHGNEMSQVLNRIYSTLSDPRQRAIYDANGAKAAEEWNNDGWNPEPVAIVYPAISTVLKNAGQQQMYEKMVNMKEAGGTPNNFMLREMHYEAEKFAQQFIIVAFEKALHSGFQCGQCNMRLEVDGICYCKTAATMCHCNSQKCCQTKPDSRGAI